MRRASDGDRTTCGMSACSSCPSGRRRRADRFRAPRRRPGSLRARRHLRRRHGTFGDNDLRFATLSAPGSKFAARIWTAPSGASMRTTGSRVRGGYAVVDGRRVRACGEVVDDPQPRLSGRAPRGRARPPRDPARLLHAPRSCCTRGTCTYKGAIALCDTITPGEPAYAGESRPAEGGFGLTRTSPRTRELLGINNGIERTASIPRPTQIDRMYDAHTLPREGAREGALLEASSASTSIRARRSSHVSGSCTRKGLTSRRVLGGAVAGGAQVIPVGQGDGGLERIARDFRSAFRRASARAHVRRGPARTHLLRLRLLPRPVALRAVGLTQMYAPRYGALPVVTPVGGLHDTVERRGLARVARAPASW